MRIPFAVPDQVTWNDLSSLLSYWYQSKTGACLNYDHLQIVAAKLFGMWTMNTVLSSKVCGILWCYKCMNRVTHHVTQERCSKRHEVMSVITHQTRAPHCSSLFYRIFQFKFRTWRWCCILVARSLAMIWLFPTHIGYGAANGRNEINIQVIAVTIHKL